MWVMTLHSHGGSTGEAMDVQWPVSFPTQAAAESLTEALNSVFEAQDKYWYAQCFEVVPVSRYDLPQATPAQLAQQGMGPTPAGKIAINVGALVEILTEYETPDLLPEPVSKEDEQAAIDSILKGMQPCVPDDA